MTLEKHYQDDWAKAKSRDLVGKMLDETILTFRKPKDVKVLHFGGIDLAEAKQVYLPRGIPPQNIVSIERDKDIAQAQRNLGLGVNVIHGNLEDYIESEKELAFDVVSLDYIGPISDGQLVSLTGIRKKQTRKQFPLHSANLTRRDHNSYKWYAIGSVERRFLENPERDYLEHRKFMVGSGSSYLKLTLEMDKLSSSIEENGIEQEGKRESYLVTIKNALSSLVEPYSNFCTLEELLKFTKGEFFEQFKKLAIEAIGEKFPTQKEPWALFKKVFGHKEAYRDIRIAIQNTGTDSGTSSSLAQMIIGILPRLPEYYGLDRIFRPINGEGYSYISESGSPMTGAVYFMANPEREIQAAREIGRAIGYPRKLKTKGIDTRFLTTNIRTYINRLLDGVKWKEFTITGNGQDFSKALKERTYPEYPIVFLGNSSKPILTKKRAIQAFDNGESVEDIQRNYRGWANLPLAQWKAHHTMGTYREDMADESTEDSNLEKITKEQALDLLVSNIPVQEIYEAHPTSFTPAQLRAFKAHMTMGTYQTEAKND